MPLRRPDAYTDYIRACLASDKPPRIWAIGPTTHPAIGVSHSERGRRQSNNSDNNNDGVLLDLTWGFPLSVINFAATVSSRFDPRILLHTAAALL